MDVGAFFVECWPFAGHRLVAGEAGDSVDQCAEDEWLC